MLKSPYPYFGGKSKIAPVVWRYLGNTPNYVEPFLGSAAVLLARPEKHLETPRIETVNDKDGMISNFWRALQAAPDDVAKWADWPVSESDLHARHYWLVQRKEALTEHLEADPDFYDAKIAGWWVWGMACWIGSGFCSGEGPWTVQNGRLVNGRGEQVWRQLPHLGDAGQGINRQRPHLGDAGRGINRQLQDLDNTGRGILRNDVDLSTYLNALSERLRRVRVCSGDWTRVLGPSVTVKHGLTGVFLDPPYIQDGRDNSLYNHDHPDIAAEVRAWAIANGDDPLLRIAYCGYEDGYEWPDSWTAHRWTGPAGFDTQNRDRDNQNRRREVIWFSPHCLQPVKALQLALFGD